jgi:HEAT repeat protein
LPASIAALQSPEAEVRRRAAEVIRPFGSEASAAVESLTALLNDEDAPIRQAAAATLEAIGEAAAPAADRLNALFYDEDADVRRAALLALGRIDGFAPEALPVLEAYGEAWQPTGIRPSQAPGQFEQSAAPDEAMLLAIAGIFVLRRDRISLARLSAAVYEQPAEFRAQLGGALVAVASGKSTHRLGSTAALAVANAGLRAEASDDRVLRRMSMIISTPIAGTSAEKVAWAARWLHDPDVATRRYALQSLSALHAESRIAAPLLVEAIEDDHPDIRRQAVRAMGAMQDPTEEVIQALAQAVRDADDRVRFEAVNALGEIGRRNEVVEDALEEALQDRVLSVRETAVWARRQIVTSRPQAE